MTIKPLRLTGLWFAGLCLLSSSLFFSLPTRAEVSLPELIVYTYDSFAARGGLGPEIIPLFEKKCGCKVRLLASGDGGQLLTRLQIDSERKKPTAHVVVGLDQHLWDRAKEWVEPWGKWTPKDWNQVVDDTKVTKSGEGFLPFDYGIFAFMSDRTRLKELKLEAPKKLSELLDSKWRRKIILEDPRTSTPGLAFLLFTRDLLGAEGQKQFWSVFKSQWLSLTPGWDEAYGLFLKQEAPLVWSYTTSQAYHVEHGDKEGRYQTVILEDGHPIQVEGAALVKGTLDAPGARERAKLFLEFLISPEVQALVPKKNWMLPVRKQVSLPASFEKLPKPKKLFRLQSAASETQNILADWSRVVEGRAGK